MTLGGWGNYPMVDCREVRFRSHQDVREIVLQNSGLIPRGSGRSYGDSALASTVVHTTSYNWFVDFDAETGVLNVQSGVTLAEILTAMVPRGWFLRVTPGTKLITVGGAIASDVHGTGHHIEGCFSECVRRFTLMKPDGDVIQCSRDDHAELFHATCGGMGLTGVILDAEIALTPVQSAYLEQTTIKTRNLEETFNAFEDYKDTRYSVAWFDCLATGKDAGRALLMVGDFRSDGDLSYTDHRKISVPFNFPTFTLNRLSGSVFNALVFHKERGRVSTRTVDIDTFFYPLDAIDHWNRVYGKRGFVQYQYVMPKDESLAGTRKVLDYLTSASLPAYLAVLKLCGPANDNYLSFPMEGYSLAMDFRMQDGLLEKLEGLDKVVAEFGGRHYLTKDARLDKTTFEKGYPRIAEFRDLRQKHGMSEKFQSYQSRRVGI